VVWDGGFKGIIKLKLFFDLIFYFKNCLEKDVYWKNA
jgi:hypothetical protein